MKPEIMQFFGYDHLREELKAVSKPFGDLATELLEVLPDNEQRAVALQKLLEAKDAAVRARLALASSKVFTPDQLKALVEQISEYMRDGGRLIL